MEMGLNKSYFDMVLSRLNIRSIRGDWSRMVVRRPHGCSMWKGILAGWKIFHNFIFIRVRNDNSDMFWHDV